MHKIENSLKASLTIRSSNKENSSKDESESDSKDKGCMRLKH